MSPVVSFSPDGVKNHLETVSQKKELHHCLSAVCKEQYEVLSFTCKLREEFSHQTRLHLMWVITFKRGNVLWFLVDIAT